MRRLLSSLSQKKELLRPVEWLSVSEEALSSVELLLTRICELAGVHEPPFDRLGSEVPIFSVSL